MDATTQAYEHYLGQFTQSYRDYLDAFGLRAALNAELALEDDYQEHVQVILRKVHADQMANAYTGPDAFCGGGQAAQTLLRTITASMCKAGRQIPESAKRLLITDPVKIVHPLMFCGLVPDGDLGVNTRTGGLALFDVALWFFLRLGAQAVAAQLGAATGDYKWGPDESDSRPLARFRERLDGYLRLNQSLRQDTYVHVIRGPREMMRRQLNFACVVWILGHEYGHLAAEDLGPPPPHLTHWSEKSELWSRNREFRADRIADALVHTPWFNIEPIAAALAPVFVHTLQAFILRTNHAAGRKAPYWTHDVPELRALASVETLSFLGKMIGGKEVNEQYQAAQAFREWLWAQMNTDAMYAEDVPDGTIPLSSTSMESPPSGQPASEI